MFRVVFEDHITDDAKPELYDRLTEVIHTHMHNIEQENPPLTPSERNEELARRVRKQLIDDNIPALVDFMAPGTEEHESIREFLNTSTNPLVMINDAFRDALQDICLVTIRRGAENGIDLWQIVEMFANSFAHVFAATAGSATSQRDQKSDDANTKRVRQLLFRVAVMALAEHTTNPDHSCMIRELNVPRDELADDLRSIADDTLEARASEVRQEYNNLREALAAKNTGKMN